MKFKECPNCGNKFNSDTRSKCSACHPFKGQAERATEAQMYIRETGIGMSRSGQRTPMRGWHIAKLSTPEKEKRNGNH